MGGIKEKEKIAELCGAVMGDGWIESRETGFFIAGDPTEDREYYDTHLSDLIGNILKISVKPKDFPYWRVYGVSLYKRELIKKLLSFGLTKGKKAKSAYIPSWILTSHNKRLAFSFLRGLFDTDGCIFCQRDYTKYSTDFTSKYHSKIRVRIGCISKELINQASYLCAENNIHIVKRILKRGFSHNRNRQDVHILEINELESIKKWFKEVKPSNNKHITKYLIWKRFGFCPPYTTLQQRKEILKNRLNPYSLYKQG